MIERIHAQAAPEVVEAVKAGVSIISRCAVADLPEGAARCRRRWRTSCRPLACASPAQAARQPEAAEMDFEEANEDEIASRDAVLLALEQLGEDAPALRRRVVALTRENDTRAAARCASSWKRFKNANLSCRAEILCSAVVCRARQPSMGSALQAGITGLRLDSCNDARSTIRAAPSCGA